MTLSGGGNESEENSQEVNGDNNQGANAERSQEAQRTKNADNWIIAVLPG